MNKLFFIPLIVLVSSLLNTSADAQSMRRYKRYEAGVFFGTSHYLGEIGGIGNTRRNFIYDMQVKLTRPLLGTYVLYRINPVFSAGGSFSYAQIAGDDKLSLNAGRRLRNSNFKSHILELSAFGHAKITSYHDIFRRYIAYKNRKHYNITFYGMLGVGIFHFDPKSEYQGTYYRLQPLGTEGQGIIAGKKKYSLLQVCIPIGGGFQFTSRTPLRLSFEVGYRKIFTDYLDDISTVYADPEEIEKKNGPIAAALANRVGEVATKQEDLNTGIPGYKRGDPSHNDSYFFVSFKAGYAFNLSKRFRYRAKF